MIDPELQAQLRAKYNPDGSDLRRLQLRMLDILKYIDKVCRENNITYWLSSGTCLGAVRHGGFIPWDDDVDIEMLEPDYRRFLQVMGTTPRDGYILQTRANEPSSIYTFAKMRDFKTFMKEGGDYDEHFRYTGAFVDIFHLEPSRSLMAHKIAAPLFWRGINYRKDKRISIRLKCACLRALYKTIYPLLHMIDTIKPNGQLRQALGSHFKAPRYMNEVVPTQRIAFEDTCLPIPGNVDAYLGRLYGDYMALPDLTNHIPHTHKVEFYN